MDRTETSKTSPPMGTARTDEQGLGSLVSGIVEDLQDIVRGEVRLAKTEIREEATSMGKGAALVAGGALVALTGFILLMLGVTYLLNKSLEMWLSAGIVGLALLLVGGGLAMAGRSRITETSFKPAETIDSLKEDQQWASQQIKSVKK
jgi:uncharacterized membrane protein YqjE